MRTDHEHGATGSLAVYGCDGEDGPASIDWVAEHVEDRNAVFHCSILVDGGLNAGEFAVDDIFVWP